jgi:hypothetical protein
MNMNRRQLFHAVGGGFLGFEGMRHFKPAPLEPNLSQFRTVRHQRYERYDNMLQNNSQITREMARKSIQIANRIYDRLNLRRYDSLNLFNVIRLDNIIFQTARYGDWFGEMVFCDSYAEGSVFYQSLPADSIYRIETTKGKLLEFQQSKEGPDYAAIARCSVDQSPSNGSFDGTALRFSPEKIVHVRPVPRNFVVDDFHSDFRLYATRRLHYPYGVSALASGKLVMDDGFENDMIEGVRELVGRFNL